MLAPIILLAAAAPAADPCATEPNDCIIFTHVVPQMTVVASRVPVRLEETGLSISQIDLAQIEGLSLPLVKDYLTWCPALPWRRPARWAPRPRCGSAARRPTTASPSSMGSK